MIDSTLTSLDAAQVVGIGIVILLIAGIAVRSGRAAVRDETGRARGNAAVAVLLLAFAAFLSWYLVERASVEHHTVIDLRARRVVVEHRRAWGSTASRESLGFDEVRGLRVAWLPARSADTIYLRLVTQRGERTLLKYLGSRRQLHEAESLRDHLLRSAQIGASFPTEWLAIAP